MNELEQIVQKMIDAGESEESINKVTNKKSIELINAKAKIAEIQGKQ